MNSDTFTYLLNNPSQINNLQAEQLEEIVNEFPYFQSARIIQLKALNAFKSFKYNNALKKTAAYTIDRTVLFDFITSQKFSDKTAASEIPILEEIEVIDVEIIKVLHKKITDSFSNKTSTGTLQPIKTIEIKDDATEILAIGTPINFNSKEPHSFNEWMQLILKKPIDRTDIEENTTTIESKLRLIDKFIEANPKIKPVDKIADNQPVILEETADNENLMTETLAKVYLEQKKYENAIKAYRILSLKYPEKSGFFADRIKAIKILQINKS
jgi:hypothetical protein